MTSTNLLVNLSQFSAFVPVIAGMVYFTKLDNGFKALAVFVCIALVTEYFANWYAQHINGNNLPPLHIFSLIEYGFLSWVFCTRITVKYKWWVWFVLFIIAMGFAWYNAFIKGGWHRMNDFARTYDSIVLTIFSLVFFLRMLRVDMIIPMHTNALFWYTCAVFIYFSINLFFFLFFNQIADKPDGIKTLGLGIHAMVNIFANLLYAQSFRCFRNKPI
ncbi:MAG: hypothetical protein V4590_05685 [Bacteroidota bacterium]